MGARKKNGEKKREEKEMKGIGIEVVIVDRERKLRKESRKK